MTSTPKPGPKVILHAIHVTESHGAHLHYNMWAPTREIVRAGVAARAFLGPDRAAPKGLTPGFYPFRVDTDGNGIPGPRVDRVDPA